MITNILLIIIIYFLFKLTPKQVKLFNYESELMKINYIDQMKELSTFIKKERHQEKLNNAQLFILIAANSRNLSDNMLKLQKRGVFAVTDLIDNYKVCISLLHNSLDIKLSKETITICLDIIETTEEENELEEKLNKILDSNKTSTDDLMEAIRS